MGYTHYFAYDPNATSFTDAWPRMVSDAQLIAVHVQSVLDIKLADGVGEGWPEINERRIWLNGPLVGDLAHETLLIDPEPWKLWDQQAALGHTDWADYERGLFDSRGFIAGFCKTARKPYDIAVASILLRCRDVAPAAFVIASDGHWQADWNRGALPSHFACDAGPVAVLAALFADAERHAENPLVSDAMAGPPTACGARPRVRRA